MKLLLIIISMFLVSCGGITKNFTSRSKMPQRKTNQPLSAKVDNDPLRNSINKIKKGIYTVWTVPQDPKPLMPYYIYMEIDKKVSSYQIEGTLIGTDEYVECWGAINRNKDCFVFLELMSSKENWSLFRTEIPGSYEYVRDTININLTNTNGKISTNKETIQIEF